MAGCGAAISFPCTAIANRPFYPAPEGAPGDPFSDVNFKLAVMSALADDGIISLGSPPQLAQHLLGDRFDYEREGYHPIPAVQDYLARYPLTPDMLGLLGTLNLDGGNALYHHIWPFWDGESDDFDIQSLEGIASCPNIRQLSVVSMLSSVDIGLLTPLSQLADLEIGVPVVNLPALREISALRSVSILNDDIYAEVTQPGHPTRQVMEDLKHRGVRVWVHWVSHDAQPPAFE